MEKTDQDNTISTETILPENCNSTEPESNQAGDCQDNNGSPVTKMTDECRDNTDMPQSKSVDGESDSPVSGQAEADTSSADSINPYSYLERDEFTTEKFKIEISHPKRFGTAQLKKRLGSLGLKPCKVKVIDRAKCAFVNFRSEEERDKALELLPGHVWMGKPMKVKKARAAADPLLKKRKMEAASDQSEAPAKKPVHMATDDAGQVAMETENADANKTSPAERLNDVVTPWWRTPYPQQLQQKKTAMVDHMRKLGRIIEQNNPLMKSWLIKQRKVNEGLCCPLAAVTPSPVERGYRNKAEFTIGKSMEGKDKTVGFRLGQYRSGDLCVVEAEDCLHVPHNMVEAAKMVQKFLQCHSFRAGHDPETKTGHWMTATIRTNLAGQLMVMVHFHPQSLTQDEIKEETDLVRGYFAEGEGREECRQLGVTSLYLLLQSDRHDGPAPHLEQILFEQQFEEELLGLKFRISPDAFFQVNTRGAELLYTIVGDMCEVGPQTTLLDVCCGTGTIGLSLAKRVGKVIGIELCPESVKDAKHNAELNGIENAEFHCGRAEELLPWLLKRVAGQQVVAIVDPPRAGLHGEVVKALRKAHYVHRLVYVSCKPSAAIGNITDLTRCQSRRIRGPPYILTRAAPVDLFPHTPHCELAMLLVRQPQTSGESETRTKQPASQADCKSPQQHTNSHTDSHTADDDDGGDKEKSQTE